MVANNEQILVQRAQQGDRDAVGELWKMHTPKLFGYLINTLKDKTVAEDVLQNTWLKAIEALPRFQEQGKGIAGWLFAIAKNECRGHWRKSGRETSFNPLLHDVSTDDHKNIEDVLQVEHILAFLSEDDREILRLRYIADLSFADIAQALSITSIAARVRLHRAQARAQKILISQTV